MNRKYSIVLVFTLAWALCASAQTIHDVPALDASGRSMLQNAFDLRYAPLSGGYLTSADLAGYALINQNISLFQNNAGYITPSAFTGIINGGGTGVISNMAGVSANAFFGDGSALTGISGSATTNASELIIGTLDAARLPATAAKTDADNVFSGRNTFNNGVWPNVKLSGNVSSYPDSYTATKFWAVEPMGGSGSNQVLAVFAVTNTAHSLGYETIWVGGAGVGTYIGSGPTEAGGPYKGACILYPGGSGGTFKIATQGGSPVFYAQTRQKVIVANERELGGPHTIWGGYNATTPWITNSCSEFIVTGHTKAMNGLIVGSGLLVTNILSTSVLTNFGTVNAGTVTRVSIPLSGVKASDALSLGIPIEYPVASASNLIFQAIPTNDVVLVDAINNTAVNVACPDGVLRIMSHSY
jgi:hypothetical protein